MEESRGRAHVGQTYCIWGQQAFGVVFSRGNHQVSCLLLGERAMRDRSGQLQPQPGRWAAGGKPGGWGAGKGAAAATLGEVMS